MSTDLWCFNQIMIHNQEPQSRPHGRRAFAELLTPGEVAQIFRVDPKTVTRWASAGRIDSIRTPGGHRRFRLDEIRDFFKKANPNRDFPDGLEDTEPPASSAGTTRSTYRPRGF